jgi:hypothetical protein
MAISSRQHIIAVTSAPASCIVSRTARAPSSDTLLNHRIYRAYLNLQRARVDGRYTAIVKWNTRMDQLLDRYTTTTAMTQEM